MTTHSTTHATQRWHNCENTYITRKVLLSVESDKNPLLTRCLTPAKMVLLDNKEAYDVGPSETVHHRTGMDPARESKEERQALSVCSSQSWHSDRVEIYFVSVKGANLDGGTNTRSSSRIKKSWQMPADNNSVAVSILPDACKTEGKMPARRYHCVHYRQRCQTLSRYNLMSYTRLYQVHGTPVADRKTVCP